MKIGAAVKKLIGMIIHPKHPAARIVLLVAVVGLWWLGSAGYFDIVKSWLEAPSLTMKFERFTLSPYLVLRSLFVILLFFWVASFLTSSLEGRLSKFEHLRVSNRILISKIAQIMIYSLLALVALDMLGVDLTALAVFSGAIGIGLGFGLQKVASNFISGLILLFEKSVEVGDLIELDDGTAGFIRRTGGRFTLLETFDSREIMIPNEDFITSRVVNWTFTNTVGRIEVPVGVAYGSDYELVQKLILEAASEHPECSKQAEHEPVCFMEAFADSSVNFIMYMWIEDVTRGRKKVRSEVMFAIARKFDENGVTIPFPQRDVNLKSIEGETMRVSVSTTQQGGDAS